MDSTNSSGASGLIHLAAKGVEKTTNDLSLSLFLALVVPLGAASVVIIIIGVLCRGPLVRAGLSCWPNQYTQKPIIPYPSSSPILSADEESTITEHNLPMSYYYLTTEYNLLATFTTRVTIPGGSEGYNGPSRWATVESSSISSSSGEMVEPVFLLDREVSLGEKDQVRKLKGLLLLLVSVFCLHRH